MTYSYTDTIVNSLNCEEILKEYLTNNWDLDGLFIGKQTPIFERDRSLKYLAINEFYTTYFTQIFDNIYEEDGFLKKNKVITNCSYETLVNSIEAMLYETCSFDEALYEEDMTELGSSAGDNIDWIKLLVDYCDDGFEPNLENPILLRNSLVNFIGLNIVRRGAEQLAETIGESINSSVKKIQKNFRKRRETRLAKLVINRRCRELNVNSNSILPLVLEWI